MEIQGTSGTLDKDLTPGQLVALSMIERICSSISVIGCVFIIVSFLTSKAFSKPINRLIFFAGIGNLLTNIATLMARSFVADPTGPACQFQGFMIQMFMATDVLWTFCMAANLYLTFFCGFGGADIRRMERWYLSACYTIPCVPAIIYVFINNGHEKRMYGDSLLWCWISSEFDGFRIYTFYGPVWAVIFLTFIIYVRAGNRIYQQGKQLRQFSDPRKGMSRSMCDLTSSQMSQIASKTTEITITHEYSVNLEVPYGAQNFPSPRFGHDRKKSYFVTVTSGGVAQCPFSSDPQFPTHPEPPHKPRPTRNRLGQEPSEIPQTMGTPGTAGRLGQVNSQVDPNKVAWQYTRVAMLFFTTMLITWIPSSLNRVFSFANPGRVSLPLLYMSAFVLPLQGFWNTCIYVLTSWVACKNLWAEVTPIVGWGGKEKLRESKDAEARHGKICGGRFAVEERMGSN